MTLSFLPQAENTTPTEGMWEHFFFIKYVMHSAPEAVNQFV